MVTHCCKCGIITTLENAYPLSNGRPKSLCKKCEKEIKHQQYARMKTEHPKELRAYQKQHQWKPPEGYHKRLRQKVTLEVLLHYTETRFTAQNPYCNRCGFSDIRALTLDLIDGGHKRKDWPSGGEQLYRKLKREGYPKGWQVLCANCQMIKRKEREEWANQYMKGKGIPDL